MEYLECHIQGHWSFYSAGERNPLKFSDGGQWPELSCFTDTILGSVKNIEGVIQAEEPGKELIQTRDKESLNKDNKKTHYLSTSSTQFFPVVYKWLETLAE